MSDSRQSHPAECRRLDSVIDDDIRYRAVDSRDSRFDGVFFTAVTSTGIYCRPSCPAVTPKRVNCTFYPSAAAAQGAGFRACRLLPPRRGARLARVEPPRRPGRPGDAADRRRHRGPGGRRRSGPPPRLQLPPAPAPAHRRTRRRADRAGQGPPRPDRPAAAADHRAAGHRDRLRGRVRLRPAVQRHRPRGLRPHPQRAARRGRGGAAHRDPGRMGSPCGWPTGARWTATT